MFIKEIPQNIKAIIEDSVSPYYFEAQYSGWSSRNANADARLLNVLGEMGVSEVETQALLIENNVYTEDFKQETYEYIDKFIEKFTVKDEFLIPSEERNQRLDLTKGILFILTKDIICTIDPLTARDLDDALSVT
jgi:DIS3-like exonuclease 2